MSDRVAVMYLGRLVKVALVRNFYPMRRIRTPRRFGSSTFKDPSRRGMGRLLAGEMPSPLSPPLGCAFHPRCPMPVPYAGSCMPLPVRLSDQRMVRCQFSFVRIVMIILDNHYVSRELKDYIVNSGVAVLRNEAAVQADTSHQFHMVSDERPMLFAQGERLYTTSENSLAWVLSHTPDPSLKRALRCLKIKPHLGHAGGGVS
jgi:hypothetical protein